MGTFLYRTENVNINNTAPTTFTHGLGVAPAGESGEVFIRHRTATFAATVVSSNTQIVVLQGPPAPTGVNVDLTVMAFHSIIK